MLIRKIASKTFAQCFGAGLSAILPRPCCIFQSTYCLAQAIFGVAAIWLITFSEVMWAWLVLVLFSGQGEQKIGRLPAKR